MSSFLITCFFFTFIVTDTFSLPSTLLGDQPFTVVWNADSQRCKERYGIQFNFSSYNIRDNEGDSFEGDNMVIFYKDEFGNYPRVLPDGTEINGGIPQLCPLKKHLRAVSQDIGNAIPNKTFSGLAVIDWESWRPLFVHNFDSKKIYQTLSENLVKQAHTGWNKHQVMTRARHNFDKAAKRFMLSTLRRSLTLRPEGRWGFYGFPRCYKQPCKNSRHNNNRLGWMFLASSALYPSVYLKEKTESWMKKARFVHDTLHETFRVFRRFSSANKTIVVPYTRFRYEDPKIFYDESELLLTLAQSALKGSAGAVLWDSSANFEDEELCNSMTAYLTKTLGPFVRTLTTFLTNCSKSRCNSHGRCIEKRSSPVRPLHTTHARHRPRGTRRPSSRGEEAQKSQGETTSSSILNIVTRVLNKVEYGCQCYPGWIGESCGSRMSTQT